MSIERDHWYPAPPAEVWEVLVDPDTLAAWIGDRAAVLDDLAPAERLVFTWEGEGDDPSSQVEITLHPEGGGTRVRIVEQAMVAAPTVPIGFQARVVARV